MRKPKTFLLSIGLMGVASVALLVAIVLMGAGLRATALAFMIIATLAGSASIILQSARNEKQSQRVNDRLERGFSSLTQAGTNRSETQDSVDQLSIAIDQLPRRIEQQFGEQLGRVGDQLSTEITALKPSLGASIGATNQAAAKAPKLVKATEPTSSNNGKSVSRPMTDTAKPVNPAAECSEKTNSRQENSRGEFEEETSVTVDRVLPNYEYLALGNDFLKFQVSLEGVELSLIHI